MPRVTFFSVKKKGGVGQLGPAFCRNGLGLAFYDVSVFGRLKVL